MNEAEEFYERALQVRPDYDYLLKFYTEFLRTERNNPAKAEELERRAKSG